ncbi:MAG: erythromycin biosynthesis sensory transduction protein EryC1 [Bryobacteraceae bacterium]|nr:MAG: erythromycin biosynthesis sensory transduction protein EryC1 [Bryobacteraceae bacterium]
MALLYYRVPMTYASWGWREPAAALRCALAPCGREKQRLAGEIAELYGGGVSLWASGRAALEAIFQAVASASPGRTAALMPSLLCRSVAERAAAAGLRPRFFDIRPDLTPDLDHAREIAGPDTACAVVPHLYGRLSDLRGFFDFCRSAGIILIEDCAAAFLLRHPDGSPCGRHADVAIFSFNTGKTAVAGGGGALMVRTVLSVPPPAPWPAAQERRQALARLWFALSYAWPWVGHLLLFAPMRWWRAVAPQAASGRPITAVDAAIARIQMQRWPRLFRRRLEIQAMYASSLDGMAGLRLPQYRPGAYLTRLFVEFPVNVNNPRLPRYAVREKLRSLGIQTHLPYAPLHLDPGFGDPQPGACPVAESVADRCLAVPSQPELTDSQVQVVCRALREIAAGLARGDWMPEPAAADAVPPAERRPDVE